MPELASLSAEAVCGLAGLRHANPRDVSPFVGRTPSSHARLFMDDVAFLTSSERLRARSKNHLFQAVLSSRKLFRLSQGY